MINEVKNKSYKTITINGKTMRLHRYVMECHLDRKLLKTELVHHKNGDIFDNRIENLEVLTKSQHTKKHQKESPFGKRYKTKYKYDLQKIDHLFCNKRLSTKKISKIVNIPTSSLDWFIRINKIKRPTVYCKCGRKAMYVKKRQCTKCYGRDYHAKFRSQ